MNKPLRPESIPAPLAAYSHGITAPAGVRLVFTSGQLGAKPDGEIPESVEEQAVLCFENIAAILAADGMTLNDVVRFNAYVTDRAYFPIYGAVRARFVPGDAFASTLLIVSGFTKPEFKIEIEAIAARADL